VVSNPVLCGDMPRITALMHCTTQAEYIRTTDLSQAYLANLLRIIADLMEAIHTNLRHTTKPAVQKQRLERPENNPSHIASTKFKLTLTYLAAGLIYNDEEKRPKQT
jgi:hypothetical protein